MNTKLPISATIITFNEEANIKRCIDSLSFCQEIIVIDSYSQDATVEIAKQSGAIVYENSFAGYGQQKNYAASKASQNWILNFDADEEVTPSLQEELTEIINENPNDDCIYQIPRLTQYCNKWIHYGGWFPNYVSRFYNKQMVNWSEPEVHEALKAISPNTNIKQQKLTNYMHHYSFPTFKSQVEINVKYAARGAIDLINKKKRKPYLIEIFLKPIGKFIECYLLKRGILDGKEGLFIALNASYSIFMKYSIAYFDHP